MSWRVVEFMGGAKHDQHLWYNLEHDKVKIVRQSFLASAAYLETYMMRDGRAVFVGEKMVKGKTHYRFGDT
jgi:hypothetical protein